MKGNSFYKSIGIAAVFLLAGGGISQFFQATPSVKAEDNTYKGSFLEDYRVYSLVIPDELSFAGEEVPLQLTDVHEKLDREMHVNTYWQSNTLLYLKRSNKWFPVIEPILKENNIPDDFKYLALIESGLTQVVSPAGAAGFWQFMKATGKEYGLEVNSEVDERYHIEKATVAACKYLQEAYDKYGSWTLAAAAYNMGMNGLDNQLERQQVDNYYDLLLNEETARYVFRILAAKEILNQPATYGFTFRNKDLWEPIATTTVTVDSSVSDWADFAGEQGINYKVLKNLNPWLRQSYLKNTAGTAYQIKIPTEEAKKKLIQNAS
jgi:hypothetical protein